MLWGRPALVGCAGRFRAPQAFAALRPTAPQCRRQPPAVAPQLFGHAPDVLRPIRPAPRRPAHAQHGQASAAHPGSVARPASVPSGRALPATLTGGGRTLLKRAEAAVIAWMRHQTTAYDQMAIPRLKGKRREVRRLLARQSQLLLDAYRRGKLVDAATSHAA